MARSILTTKIQGSIVRADIVPRPHLIRRLSKGLRSKLIVLSAPAGSGKTSLLVDWISSAGLPAVWLSLDPEDNDTSRFFAPFFAGLESMDQEIRGGLSGALQSPDPPVA